MLPNGDKLAELDLRNVISELDARIYVLQGRIRSALQETSLGERHQVISPETAKRIRKALGVAS